MWQLEARLGRKPPIYQVRDVESWSRIAERRQALVQFEFETSRRQLLQGRRCAGLLDVG